MKAALIGVDWGTSNLRAWAFDQEGHVLARRSSASGISAIQDGAFGEAFRSLAGEWTDGSVPIVFGGMIGSRQGWREAPYAACPVDPGTLAGQAIAIDTGLGTGWILPGVSCTGADGTRDVMRGEEVQILGADVRDGIVLLPGTHSKWVRMEGGSILSFRTFMTGELFALLRQHSLLGRMMEDGPTDWPAFDLGVDRALGNGDLTALLFSVRTEGLFGAIPPQGLDDYLSGLLIGAEISGLESATAVSLIGEGALAGRYARAIARAKGMEARIISGDEAAAAGLLRLGRMVALEKMEGSAS